MIPRTYPSTFATNGQQQMVVYFLTGVVGLQRWVDYIPVKLSAGGSENSYDNDGFIAVAIIPSLGGTVQSWKDYIPVYEDAAATDVWQVSSIGYIPYNYSGFGNASLIIDFTSGGALDSRITFTRSTTGTYIDSAGVLQSAAINTHRFDYNPTTLQSNGLFIEEQRTNSVRNSTMVGAVAGTPGTLPTNWSVVASGMAFNVIGTGTENGINYIDIQAVGTTTAGSSAVRFEATNQVSAVSGESWTGSFYIRQVSGAITNITTIGTNIFGRTAANAVNADSSTGSSFLSTISATNLSVARRKHSFALADATTAFVNTQLLLTHSVGVAIDITLRIGLPQLEKGAFATSVIPTTTAAATRAADVASINTLTPWFNATEGTLYSEATLTNIVSFNTIASLSDGTSANSMRTVQWNDGTDRPFSIATGGVTQANYFNTGQIGTAKYAGAYKLNDVNASKNGSIGITDTTATIPVVTALWLGQTGSSLFLLNGYLKIIKYYPRRLTNAELQILTS